MNWTRLRSAALNPTLRDRVLDIREIEAELSSRLNDKPLARALKEYLCRTGRFRIQLDPTIPNRDGGILRQRFAVDNH
jgi:hypothetical protein